MTGPRSPSQSVKPAARRRFDPAVGEPPLWMDPRRWGSVIGPIGSLVLIGNYSSVLGVAVSTVAWRRGWCALFAHDV